MSSRRWSVYRVTWGKDEPAKLIGRGVTREHGQALAEQYAREPVAWSEVDFAPEQRIGLCGESAYTVSPEAEIGTLPTVGPRTRRRRTAQAQWAHGGGGG